MCTVQGSFSVKKGCGIGPNKGPSLGCVANCDI